MKIFVIAPTPFFSDRGTHIRIWEEARALEQHGHDVHILTYHIGDDIEKIFDTTIKVRRIRPLLFWYTKKEAGPSWQKILLDLLLLRKVWALTRKERPGIIHAHLHEGVLIGWIVQKILFWRNTPLIADFHGSLVQEMKSHQYIKARTLQSLFRFIEKTIHGMGSIAIASSVETTQHVQQDRISTVHTVLDGVNTAAYKNTDAKIALRTRFGIPQEKTIFVYTGALIANKGINEILHAIPSVIATYPQAHFILAGYPAAAVRAFIKKHNLQQQVYVLSPFSYVDLPALLQACDIALDPKSSATKQASGKILQYMAAGLPIVCFDRKNNREYLGDGAFYADEITADAFARAMCDAMESPERCSQKGAHNKETARTFSWDRCGKQLIELYESCLTKK